MTEKFYKLPVSIITNRRLRAADKIIWAAMADRIGENGFCWPGVRRLAQDTCLGVSTVLRSIERLEAEGRLKVERRGSGKANHYRLTTGESAVKMKTPAKGERCQNDNSGAVKMKTQALSKRKHNQRDPFNQTKSKGAHTRFIPPSALEVEQYARSIDFPLDAEKFVSHYAANGWMRGKTKMRDWRAAVRYWKTTENTKNEYGSGKIRDHAEPVGEFIR